MPSLPQLSQAEKARLYVMAYKDITYFARNFCYIQHPKRGRIPFDLYPFQEKAVKELGENRQTIVLKARQMGISTLLAMKALWMMIFHKDQNVIVIATKQITAKEIVDKVRLMWENLPAYIKPKETVNNKLELRFANNSRIKCFSAADDSGRSQAASLLIIDEAAFINNIDELYAAVYPSLSTGGGICILSTPNGAYGFFHDQWQKAEAGENGLYPIELPWHLHPDRNDRWFSEQVAALGPKKAAQEFECKFLASGDTVIPGDLIQKWEKDHAVDAPVKLNPNGRYHDNAYWEFEPPVIGVDYVLIVDTARGTGADESTIHVMDLENWIQVAEYAGQMPPEELAPFAVQIGYRYNKALIIAENTGIGHATCMLLDMAQYPNLYRAVAGTSTLRFDQYIDRNASASETQMVTGFSMNVATRPMAINALTARLSSQPGMIVSRRTYRQLKSFIWVNGKEQAAPGNHDDLLIMLGAGCLLQSTSLAYMQQFRDQARQSMDHFTVIKPYDQFIKQGIDPYSPYQAGRQAGHIPAMANAWGQSDPDINFNWLL